MVPDRLWNRTECVVKGLSVLTYRPGQLPGRASVLLVGSCSVLIMGPVQGFKMVPCTKSWLFEGPSTFLAPWFVPGPFRILELAPFRDLAGLESTTPCHIYSTVALIVINAQIRLNDKHSLRGYSKFHFDNFLIFRLKVGRTTYMRNGTVPVFYSESNTLKRIHLYQPSDSE